MTGLRRAWLVGVVGAILGGCTLLMQPSDFVAEGAGIEAGTSFDVVEMPVDAAPRTIDAGQDVDAAMPVLILASDSFDRQVADGFGEAEIGGGWTVSGGGTTRSVMDHGIVVINQGAASFAGRLPSVESSDCEVAMKLTSDKRGSGDNGLYVSLVGRDVGGERYAARAIVSAAGRISRSIVRTNGAENTVMGQLSLVDTFEPGDTLAFKFQVVGQSPTTLRSRIWNTKDPEPNRWDLEVMDSSEGVQRPGFIGLDLYLSTSADNTPITVFVDDFVVRSPVSAL